MGSVWCLCLLESVDVAPIPSICWAGLWAQTPQQVRATFPGDTWSAGDRGEGPGGGLGSVLWCQCLQSVLWLQRCCNDPNPCQVPGTAASQGFAMKTSPRCHEGGMLGSQSWALLPAACLGWGGLCLPPGGHWRKARGAIPWVKQQYWDGKCRNAKAGGQIQGLMPHTLPFSLPLSLQGWWWCSREVGRMCLGCRENPVPLLVCTNGRWKGKGREAAAGTAEEPQKCFALFPAKCDGDSGRGKDKGGEQT